MKAVDATSVYQSGLLKLYRDMLLIRKSELQLAKSCQQGLVHGACHTYVGQEAIAAGVCSHLNNDDAIFSTHRGHGHALAKGLSPDQLIAELYGRETGCSHGRGGSMHLFAPEVGMMGTSGIVAPCILQAVGAGYSFKVQGTSQVGMAFFGDGAVSNGAFHEGLNLAGIWKLPTVFVCENNGYATEVSFEYSAANPDVASRGVVYGMPGVKVDGNDVVAVAEAAEEAIDRARRGEGPTLLECVTYRTRAHAEGMVDFGYRESEEVREWKERCPIARARGVLLSDGAEEERLTTLEGEVAEQVKSAHEAAVASDYPASDSATHHVFAKPASPPPVAPADESAPAATREISYSDATLEALTEAMDRDPSIFVLGEGVGPRGGNFNTTAGLYEKHGPTRVCDTPICERGFVGLSAGAAMTGTRPVIDFMFVDFVLDAVGEIVNQIAKIQYMSGGRLKMPVLLRGCIGAGHAAATHHSGSYHSMFGHFPGLRVVVPSTPYDAKGLMSHALCENDPVLFLEHRELLAISGPVPEASYTLPFGCARVVRQGTDVTVVALARMVHHSLEAIDKLSDSGISVELIDPRTVAPLDIDTIQESVSKTGRLLIVEESFGPFGLASEIAAQIVDRCLDDLDAPIKRLNGTHAPIPYSPTLESAVIPQVEDVVRAITDLMDE